MKRVDTSTKTVTYKDGPFVVKRTVCSLRGHQMTVTYGDGEQQSTMVFHDVRHAERLAEMMMAAAKESIQLPKE